MEKQEVINALKTCSDDELRELEIGCNNSCDDGKFYVNCPYNKGHCTRGALLTSTLIGAHPNDCPIYKRA